VTTRCTSDAPAGTDRRFARLHRRSEQHLGREPRSRRRDEPDRLHAARHGAVDLGEPISVPVCAPRRSGPRLACPVEPVDFPNRRSVQGSPGRFTAPRRRSSSIPTNEPSRFSRPAITVIDCWRLTLQVVQDRLSAAAVRPARPSISTWAIPPLALKHGGVSVVGGGGERTLEGNDLWHEFESASSTRRITTKARAALVYDR